MVSGGKDTGGGGWGNAILTLNADTQNFVPFLRNTFGLGLNHEDAVELYYSAAVTPWLTVSPSLQVLRSGLNKALDPSSNLNNLDTAYLAGVRVGIRF